MTDSSAKTYIFSVRYPNNPQWDRALYLYYSVMRNKITRWKICSLKYNKNGHGAEVNSKHPSFEGSVDQNGFICDLKKGSQTFGTITLEKSLNFMRAATKTTGGDTAFYMEGSHPYTIELITIGSGDLYEAFLSQMTAVA